MGKGFGNSPRDACQASKGTFFPFDVYVDAGAGNGAIVI